MDVSNDSETLNSLFFNAYEGFENLINSKIQEDSLQTQSSLKHTIDRLKKLTILSSSADLYSENERYTEVCTSSLKFLLLPYMLGVLTSKLLFETRLEAVQLAIEYLTDFLNCCQQLEITEHMSREWLPSNTSIGNTSGHTLASSSIAEQAAARNEKIKRYRSVKLLEKQLSTLKETMKHSTDDGTERSYYVTLLNHSVAEACSLLLSLCQERRLLSARDDLSAVAVSDTGAEEGARRLTPQPPLVLTRANLVSQVFGHGYPSVPQMSVAEFYESKIRDGTFKCTDPIRRYVPSGTNISDNRMSEGEDKTHDSNEDSSDDEEKLMKARRMDEFRDTHRRGEGNRHNRS